MIHNKEYENVIPIIDRLASYIEQNQDHMNSEDFMNHLMTLFTAVSGHFFIIFFM